MYQEITGARRQQELEERVLARWREHGVFPAALRRREGAPPFTFYEGPPTANGRPGIHHVLARTLKDAVCRYHDLKGCRVERKAGWDTHGLPVEVEVEKALQIHGKDAIQAYGVEAFTRKCIESVFRYTGEWERLTERIGYWLDMGDAYATFHESYIESVWWSLKQLFDKGLLYQGYKVVWWWPKGGTALSSAEVGLGYRETTDPSVTVAFPLAEPFEGAEASLLAWTTTPWTLPSNAAIAVRSDLAYAIVECDGRRYVAAEARLGDVFKDREHRVEKTVPGSALTGLSYTPPFSFGKPEGGRAYVVVPADFVTTESGTGLVHLAPGFGEDDHLACKREGIGFLQLLLPDGTMPPECGPVAGMDFKEADKVLIRDLKDRGLLFDRDRYTHEYPFCWRADSEPLVQYARASWFIKTSEFKDRFIAHNRTVSWHPGTIREGRFGDFLRNNVDWALSRERFWGTPLPIWVNDETGSAECLGSVAELLERNPQAFAGFENARALDPGLNSHLRVHKPWIDGIVYAKPGEPGVYRRVPDVIDCWYDSGAMPFAQRHYPFENQETFEASFPADFICEGLDQTRGWFYSLLAIGTLLFDKAPYRNVIVNGLVNDREGRKMSKSLGNTVDPWDVIESHGADPARWYLLAGSPPWQPKSFDMDAVGEVARKVFGTLWPSFNFFALYAGLDGWKPGGMVPPPEERPAIDRWILSRAHTLIRNYRSAMDAYDPMRATRLAGEFLVDELSNWYIRRNRARFWKGKNADDKSAAYDTLYQSLLTLAHLLAPIAPMSADALYHGLHPDAEPGDSIHLKDLPEAREDLIDRELEERMAAVLKVVSLGRAAREAARIRVRQPLPRLIASGPDQKAIEGILQRELAAEIRDELNVKELLVVDRSGEYCSIAVKPNLPVLGKRLGRRLGAVKTRLENLDPSELRTLESTGRITLPVDGEEIVLEDGDLLIQRTGKPGFAVAAEAGYMAALDTALSPALVQEGLARELINRIQNHRKKLGLSVSMRIRLDAAGSPVLLDALLAHETRIRSEVLATTLTLRTEPRPRDAPVERYEVEGEILDMLIEPDPEAP